MRYLSQPILDFCVISLICVFSILFLTFSPLLSIEKQESQVTFNNQYPIVLVHGFIGWGPEEMGGYRYWGGFYDLEEYLEKLGFEVYTVSIGPVSSNWERSVELYHQLKGGQVDYGKHHAEHWGVIQKPKEKNYVGLYPLWDENHPVHLVGHSMGGQTIRMLLYQLTNTFNTDSTETVLEENPLLGEIHERWINSITSIATPHNGTTLSDIVTNTFPFLKNSIGLAAVVGTQFYDFDLQHWGFYRKEGESWRKYFRRMRKHPAWGTQNISAWDLSLEGAQQLNTFLRADPNVYYFSYVLSSTHLNPISRRHVPDKGMSVILRIRARRIGKKIVYWDNGTPTDSTWFENDGVVNTISQRGPTTGLNGPDPIVEYKEDEPLIPGQWYTFGPYKMDHWYVVGQGIMSEQERQNLYNLYKEHCKLLRTLPE